MLKEERLKQLHALIETVSKEELIWINGYLSGIVSGANESILPQQHTGSSATAGSPAKINLVYGTETGNAKRLATQLAGLGKKRGLTVKLTGLDQYRINDLVKEEYFLVVISTQGEGEPPAPAKKWYDHIHQNAINLSKMKFAVLALGDSGYPQFCKTGEDVDLQLNKLGAERLLPLKKCDVDYEADALQWFDNLTNLLNRQPAPAQTAAATTVVKKAGGKKYYTGQVITNINLNDRGSNKETYHIEIACEENIAYEAGDALALVPCNRQDVIERILSITGIDPQKTIATAKQTDTVRELLHKHLNICYLLGSTIKKYAALTGHNIPDTRMDLVDLLRIYPVGSSAQFEEVLGMLTPIAPRLYSISSSPKAHENEVHITVARNYFEVQEETRTGLCSEYLGVLPVDTEVTFYIHPNRSFRMPEPDKDIIMIGPGTGIAPFRSFLYERDAVAATGKSWLFFGEQHFVSDFLYQTELQAFLDTGVLSRIDLAFSRDQQEKIYVQQRMLEQGASLYQWISNGAAVYISGSKDPMSKDVEKAWLEIIEVHGKKTKEEAITYWEQIKKEGRYQKDVY
ncbi:MAG TPA: flavodoxin domain-containing protein [Chitinophagaceae bacterium]|nr:flavodoxin domain-containing protein [Chitinophagaceae bacterium]